MYHKDLWINETVLRLTLKDRNKIFNHMFYECGMSERKPLSVTDFQNLLTLSGKKYSLSGKQFGSYLLNTRSSDW